MNNECKRNNRGTSLQGVHPRRIHQRSIFLWKLGDEWQVLSSEPKLVHEVDKPQFPEHCIKPDGPRGERKRRLTESKISIEAAEAACASALTDPLAIKYCVYDILATQDMDVAGAL